MVSNHDENSLEKGDIASHLDDKGQIEHVDSKTAPPSIPVIPINTRVLEAPEWIRNLSPEERVAIESRLKRKIDFRLLPMIILIYIMNYIDRVTSSVPKSFLDIQLTGFTE